MRFWMSAICLVLVAGVALGGPNTGTFGGDDPQAVHVDETGEINALGDKASPVGADLIIIEDSATSFSKKKISITNLPAGTPGTDSIGTVELDDGAFSPLAGEYIQIDPADLTQIKYRTDAEHLDDIASGVTAAELIDVTDGGEATSHTHAGGGGDDITVTNGFTNPVDPILNDSSSVSVTGTDATPDQIAFVVLPAGVDHNLLNNHVPGEHLVVGSINHDITLNYNAADHLEWAAASVGTIHATNYVDNDNHDGATGFDANEHLLVGAIDHDLTLNTHGAPLLLAGGTMTGLITTDNLGIEFTESDTNPTCVGDNFNIYADLSDQAIKMCVDGVTVTPLDSSDGPLALSGVTTMVNQRWCLGNASSAFDCNTVATDFDFAGALDTDSVSANELNATGVETELEAVLDLPQLQGTLLDSQLVQGAAWTIWMNNSSGTADRAPVAVAAIAADATPVAGEFLLGYNSGGIVKFDIDDLPAGSVGDDHIDAVTEIAIGIKRAGDDADLFILTTNVALPTSDSCMYMDSTGTVQINLDSACGTASGGDDITVTNGFTNPVDPILNDTATIAVTGTDAAPDQIAFDIVANSVGAAQLATILTFGATDHIDLSAIDSSTLTEGLTLPQLNGTCAVGFGEGQVCWESDTTPILKIGNAASFEFFYPSGTMTDGLLCTFDDTGDEFDCNTALDFADDDLSDDLPTALSGVTTVTDTQWCQGNAGSGFGCDVVATDFNSAGLVNASHSTSADAHHADESTASESVVGIIEIATQAETDAGTETLLAITPEKLEAWDGGATGSITKLGTIATGTWNGTAIDNVRGGTGDDTSSVTGVPIITAGNWTYPTVLDIAQLDANVVVDNAGHTYTGSFTQDFSAHIIKIESGSNATTASAGELAVNTDGEGQLAIHTGAVRFMNVEQTECRGPLESAVAADDDIPIYRTRNPIEIISWGCTVDGGTAPTVSLTHSNNNDIGSFGPLTCGVNAITYTTTGISADADRVLAAGDGLEIDIGTAAATDSWTLVCFTYIETIQ